MDLNALQQSLSQSSEQSRWNPPFCGNIDMCIRRDGSWWYLGTPIGREALVRLFAGVLRYEDNRYYLVTPVEKVGIQVEDVPFVVIDWRWQDSALWFKTQYSDWFCVNAQHPVELRPDAAEGATADAWVPYVMVRDQLWARLHRNVYYQLVEQAQTRQTTLTTGSKQEELVLPSGEYDIPLGRFEL